MEKKMENEMESGGIQGFKAPSDKNSRIQSLDRPMARVQTDYSIVGIMEKKMEATAPQSLSLSLSVSLSLSL